MNILLVWMIVWLVFVVIDNWGGDSWKAFAKVIIALVVIVIVLLFGADLNFPPLLRR